MITNNPDDLVIECVISNNPKAECDNNGNFIEVINDCHWKGACDVCRLMVLPCQRVIENGECDTLKEFFKSQKHNREVKT